MKWKQSSLFLLAIIVLSSFTVHKFYVGMFQMKFVPQKKELQITTRIFVDDLNLALEKKFHKKTFIGEPKESQEDEVFMQKYLAEKFKLKIKGQPKNYTFLSKEIENNVVICYLKVKDLAKINSLEIENSILMEIYPEQQNIIQLDNNGEKQSLLLTEENYKGMLK
ncbi:DUF6702 family protein [Flavobacterium dankookense]|uniref:Peptidase E n=1 Tax=Flavobacterium dankookense TaxID=706186 RepID=A0A4R6Q833_9FLAO|nr:DUF6702 family protein [Flavobacterium dankookense]TDP58207.1 hypothetical protein BC748_2239 [Flavobacterium dankookense]